MSEEIEEPSDPVRVTVLVRADCRTCDRMTLVVRAVCEEVGEEWETVDIDSGDEDLRWEYGDRIPVTLVDGAELASWRVEPDDLRRALA